MENWNIESARKSNNVISFNNGRTWMVIINDVLQKEEYVSKLEAQLYLKSITI